ncbi:MAG: hypothetical protein NTV81_01865, partial [Candidatus Komeilibacteria bacterium]|nr:hypothetical protein [Candidatus Komeilibacteria bacterium]
VLKTELLQEVDDSYWFYFQCPHCLVGLIFLLNQPRGLPAFSGWPTDLTYGELVDQAQQSGGPLAADELLTLHEFFAKNNQVNSLIK